MAGETDGFRFRRRVPEGDNRERLVCEDCGFIHYVNPRIVVAAVCTYEDRLLLCVRDIEPRRGYWTIPAGFLEEGEDPEEGARREAWEEAFARIEIRDLLGVYAVPRISQVHLVYRARLLDPAVRAGDETSEARLVRWEDVPWERLAFPTIERALRHFRAVSDRESIAPFRETL